MLRLAGIVTCALVVALTGARAEPALSDPIGETIAVIPAAFSEGEGGSAKLELGQDVLRDAFIRTDKGGATTLRFRDQSELKIGPRSRVKLDRFVYADDKTFSNAGVMMLKGSFRWATGHSPKPAYDLRTPTATIGIRGTILDIRVTADDTVITVIEGAIRACAVESTDCIDATPETGAVRITKTSAELDAAKPQRRAEVDPPKKPPLAKTKTRKAEAAKPKPQRIRQAKAAPKKRQRVIIVEQRERVYVVRRRPQTVDPGFAISIGLGILGNLGDRPRYRRPPMTDGYKQ